jgi:hypothetical protein
VFFNLIFELEFVLLRHLYPPERTPTPQHLIDALYKQLFFLSHTLRLSISIEHMAFVLNKVMHLWRQIPSGKLRELVGLIEASVDRFQVVRVNLLEKTEFFSYHMKKHSYFAYLEAINKIQSLGEGGTVGEWKQKIRQSIEQRVESLPSEAPLDI